MHFLQRFSTRNAVNEPSFPSLLMLRCYWPQRSGCGYFSPDLEKMKQLLVCSKHRNAWKDNGNVLKVSFSIQGNVTQWKETECSTPFVVTAATSLLLNWLKFIRKVFTFFFLIAKLEDFKTLKRRTMNPGNWSLSPSANYAGWSHKQIKRRWNLTALKF